MKRASSGKGSLGEDRAARKKEEKPNFASGGSVYFCGRSSPDRSKGGPRGALSMKPGLLTVLLLVPI